MPFSDLQYSHSFLGEMSREGAFYPLLIVMILWGFMLIKNTKLKVPKHISAKVLVLFLLWITTSSLVNAAVVFSLQTKGRSGIEKLVLQLVLTTFVVLSALLIFNIVSRVQQPLCKFRKYVLFSFIVSGVYSLVEIAFLFGNSWAEAVLRAIDSLIRIGAYSSSSLYTGNRLRSVTNEPSWFAMYCSFIFPWVLSYVFTKQRHIWIYLTLSIYLLVLVVFMQSRTAYFTIALQLSLFLLGLFSFKQGSTRLRLFLFKKSRLISFAILSSLIILFLGALFGKIKLANNSILDVFYSLISNDETYNISNLTRFGAQVAGFKIALSHPIFGVGLGQYGFYMPSYVPEWAKVSIEIQNAISPVEGTPWPSAYSVYARIAAELGAVGLGIWLLMWFLVMTACYRRYQLNNHITCQRDILGLALMISMIGVLLSGLTTDSLRFFGFWINLGLSWSYLRKPETFSVQCDLKHNPFKVTNSI